jgi:hypothetical protein
VAEGDEIRDTGRGTMSERARILAARVLIPTVGLGLERLLVRAGVLEGARLCAGSVAYGVFELRAFL